MAIGSAVRQLYSRSSHACTSSHRLVRRLNLNSLRCAPRFIGATQIASGHILFTL